MSSDTTPSRKGPDVQTQAHPLPKLKRCPLCNSEMNFKEAKGKFSPGGFSHPQNDCLFAGFGWGTARNIEKWNLRSDPVREELVEARKAVIDECAQVAEKFAARYRAYIPQGKHADTSAEGLTRWCWAAVNMVAEDIRALSYATDTPGRGMSSPEGEQDKIK